MYDNCTCTQKKGGKKGEREREGEILAALHGILGPTGAAVPGENPFTAIFWPRRCYSL